MVDQNIPQNDAMVTADQPQRGMVRAVANAQDIANAVSDYKRIQDALDKSMKDCVQMIQGKPYRKKNYWRAIATAFNLDVRVTSERRVDLEDDWGYEVLCEAAAQNGRRASGDGSCFASEVGSPGTELEFAL